MKTYKYTVPDHNMQLVTIILTEAEILEQYYPSWVDKMRKVGRGHLISNKKCIKDWVVEHWAEEVESG